MASLYSRLTALDGKGYGAYKSLVGRYDLGRMTLAIDRVQSDPYAPPSKMHVELPNPAPDFHPVPVCDQVARAVARAFRGHRDISIDSPGQEVLPTASCVDRNGTLHIRFFVQLPARGRRILGRAAAHLICDDLPDALEDAFEGFDPTAAVQLYNQQERMRAALGENVAFIADGAILPRATGTSPLPLTGAVPFRSPESLRTNIAGVTGMGIPRGVTVIVGGGFHGKSTLLNALSLGVYNHTLADGREYAVTNPTAVHVRAEDGRAVAGVDISEFISSLPTGADTTHFTTANASGSTSQAASVMEALEACAEVLLIDEDTSATNFMIRDARMKKLVTAEPITPLVDRVRALWRDHGVSTVIVAGGSSAFIDVADTVIAMENYEPRDATPAAKELAEPVEEQAPFVLPKPRIVAALKTQHGKRKKQPQAKDAGTIRHGKENVDISAVEQVVSRSQTAGIARALGWMEDHVDGRTPLTQLAEDATAATSALVHGDDHPGALVMPRPLEVTFALSRHRGLKV